ncbi:hypothetical protein ACR3S7_000824 [Campylobacter lari]|uniref:hypothetical protein n=1 Tax=Campylobacter lari TaxID=201 RepID=UPI00105A3750|nr:hypothetical protein [Campylobacter lari]EAI4441281.1 hypothetical protein [Campylobacter lari]EAI4447665.1 hypothetical protein [Campylobacter lari]EAK5534641.1 hypothetical protein [Campylobacter lari]EDP6879896.1 hypothetical protein [Campylobacter lari]EFB0440824.1 hypothetical protein [Campylobacter lari]
MKFFKSSLELEFEESTERYEEFLQEYVSSNNYVNLSKWKKLASRVEFSEGEQLIFDLLMDLKQELYLIKNDINKTKLFVNLKYKSFVIGVNFTHIQFKDRCLMQDEDYYARFNLNGQKISIFFKALNENEAKITQIKAEDGLVYDNFVANMQRAMIKILKEQENG